MSQQAPEHITAHAGTVTFSGGWYAHEHPHSHPAGRLAFDDEPINHTKNVNHRHEHCWQPQQRHHHEVEPSPSGPEEPR
jgi:hypothetical protein